MSLEISYFTGLGRGNIPIYGDFISAEQRTVSGTSAQSGVTPTAAAVTRITATANTRILYSGNPTATDDGASIYLAAGETIDLQASAGYKVAGITAS